MSFSVESGVMISGAPIISLIYIRNTSLKLVFLLSRKTIMLVKNPGKHSAEKGDTFD